MKAFKAISAPNGLDLALRDTPPGLGIMGRFSPIPLYLLMWSREEEAGVAGGVPDVI